MVNHLSKGSLEAAADEKPCGDPVILGMTQFVQGIQITVTVLYKYRT